MRVGGGRRLIEPRNRLDQRIGPLIDRETTVINNDPSERLGVDEIRLAAVDDNETGAQSERCNIPVTAIRELHRVSGAVERDVSVVI